MSDECFLCGGPIPRTETERLSRVRVANISPTLLHEDCEDEYWRLKEQTDAG